METNATTPSAVSNMSASASPAFSVRFVNNSQAFGSACIYQQMPDNYSNVMSIAWLCQRSYPNTQANFQWQENYSFVAGQGMMMPGAQFNIAQSVGADIANNNQTTFAMYGGTGQFSPPVKGQPGAFIVQQESNVQMNSMSIGIGMDNSPVFAVGAMPNMTQMFYPGSYWIAFGNFQQGGILGRNGLPGAVQLDFRQGVYSLTATLNQDNTWTIS